MMPATAVVISMISSRGETLRLPTPVCLLELRRVVQAGCPCRDAPCRALFSPGRGIRISRPVQRPGCTKRLSDLNRDCVLLWSRSLFPVRQSQVFRHLL